MEANQGYGLVAVEPFTAVAEGVECVFDGDFSHAEVDKGCLADYAVAFRDFYFCGSDLACILSDSHWEKS